MELIISNSLLKWSQADWIKHNILYLNIISMHISVHVDLCFLGEATLQSTLLMLHSVVVCNALLMHNYFSNRVTISH